MTLDAKVISNILELYEPCKGNIVEAVREFKRLYGHNISTTAIKKYWLNVGYTLNPHGGRRVSISGKRAALSEKEIKEVTNDYYLFNGSAYEAAKRGKYSLQTYLRYWVKAGLKTRSGPKAKRISKS